MAAALADEWVVGEILRSFHVKQTSFSATKHSLCPATLAFYGGMMALSPVERSFLSRKAAILPCKEPILPEKRQHAVVLTVGGTPE